MGKSAPSPPPAPNPTAVANAQGAANRDTAIAQYGLNATNQVTPYGNINYDQIGNWSYVNDAGKTITVPRYQATQTLSPDQQALLTSNTQAQRNLSDIAATQSQKLGDYLNQPADLSNKATEDRLDQLAQSRLDPILKQQQDTLESQLAAKGINPGTPAYDHAMQQFSNSRNDAYNQLLLSGNSQAFQQAVAQRNQPINEITALLSGSQVSQPNFVNTPTPGVAPTDVVGAYGLQNQANLAAYNGQVAQNSAAMGGLFGLGSAAIGGWALSEPDEKKDKERIGEAGGMGLYAFRYKHEPKSAPKRIGLMANEVQKKHPSAVKKVGGKRMVNYSRVARALANG